jgi:Homeodomain-like domain
MNALPNLRSVPTRAHPSSPSSVPAIDPFAMPSAAHPSVSTIDPFADPVRSSIYVLLGRSIGDEKAEKLITDFGGRRLYIPMAPGPGDRVTRSIGLVAALAMARMFGGDRLMIPLGTDQERRRVRILAMRADHFSIPRIARKLHCTQRYVYKVLALERSAPTPAPVAEHFKRGIINRRP